MDNNVNTIKTFKIVLANNYLKMSVKSDWTTNRTSTPRKVRTYMEAETETCHLVTLNIWNGAELIHNFGNFHFFGAL